MIPFGALQPDRGETSAPAMVADGVLPTADGYGPFPSLFTPSGAVALPGPPRGVFSLVQNNASWKVYALTATDFYEMETDFSWSASLSSGFACPEGDDWSALHFGSKLLFTNTIDGLRSYDIEAGGAVSYIADAGDPAWIFTCANTVIALNCLDSIGERDTRLIKTSGFNDQTNWISDGADYQELADGETLIAGFDLKQNTALLVQRRALVLMQFGGTTGGAQFSLQKVSDGKGAVSARGCVSFDGQVFFPSSDDFYMFSLATGLVPIGASEIAQTFLASVDQSNFGLIQASVDPLHKVVLWRYKRSVDESTTVSEVCIGYEWRLKRWFTITEQTSYLCRLATVGVTYNAATGTYDSQTLTYNDLLWAGGSPLSGALDENYRFGLLTGPSLAATITTIVSNSPVTGLISWATPITDAVAPTLELGVKDKLADATTWKAPAAMVSGGRVPLRGRGMNVQFTFRVPAGDMGSSGSGWSYAKGIDHIKGSSGGPK